MPDVVPYIIGGAIGGFLVITASVVLVVIVVVLLVLKYCRGVGRRGKLGWFW